MGLKVTEPSILTPEEVISRLPNAFEQGKASGDLLFFESTTSTHSENGIDFEVRHCPALLHKPQMPTPHFDSTKLSASQDPFEPPYPAGLLIGEIRGDYEDDKYVIMLNKFSVVEHHFLLITKEFQSQTSPPLPSDLSVAYKLLIAAEKAGSPFFAFFNCGERSGASQRHKHLQLIPAASPDGPPIEKLAKQQLIDVDTTPFSISSLPYSQYVRRLPTSLKAANSETLTDTLGDAFLSILDLAIQAIRHDPDEETHAPGPPSYNVLLTLSHIHLIPRSREKHILKRSGEATSVNALGFAGLLLVKSEQEAEAVKAEGVLAILRGVAVPRMDEDLAEPQNVDVSDRKP